MSFNGTTMYLNGDVVATSNIKNNAVSTEKFATGAVSVLTTNTNSSRVDRATSGRTILITTSSIPSGASFVHIKVTTTSQPGEDTTTTGGGDSGYSSTTTVIYPSFIITRTLVSTGVEEDVYEWTHGMASDKVITTLIFIPQAFLDITYLSTRLFIDTTPPNGAFYYKLYFTDTSPSYRSNVRSSSLSTMVFKA
jgi:hypothetical protein